MRLAVLRRQGLPALATLPVLLVALVVPAVLTPGGGTGDTVTAVPHNGPLGAGPGGADPVDGPLDGARPVRGTGAAVQVRSAVVRQKRPVSVVFDTAVPARVLAAYRAAARSIEVTDPGCNLSWSLLAGIGKVESGHAYGGAVDRRGGTLSPILGPVLDGGPGIAAIADTDGGRFDTDTVWDRAVGPMQFIPSSWALYGADGNGDGRSDPNNIADAALAAASYLCGGDRDLRDEGDRRAAVFSYNHSDDYVDLVLAWADAYESGADALSGTLLASLLDRHRDNDRRPEDPEDAALGGVSGRVGLPTGITRPLPVIGSPPDAGAGASVTAEPAVFPVPDSSAPSPSASGSEPSATSEPVATGGSTASPSPTSDPDTSSPSSTPSESDTASPSPSPSPTEPTPAESTPAESTPAPSPDPTCSSPSPTPTPTLTPTPTPSPTPPDPSPSPSPTDPGSC